MERLIGRHWHQLPAEQAAALLETSADRGLDLFEVSRRQKHFGPNEITARRERSQLTLFLLQFHQPLVYVLLLAAGVTTVLDGPVDAAVILGVVVINAVIGFAQEARAVSAIRALSRSVLTEATVIRSGERRRVSSPDLVPGDIVLLQSGDKVPADLRLLRSRELRIDESILTGESLPAEKSAETLALDVVLADRANMAYSSTLVVYGQGTGIVTATGDHTEIGRISELVGSAEVLSTPLALKIAALSRVLLYSILGLAAVTFGVGLIRGEEPFAMFKAAVALAVGAIPEGLPAAVTITLAIGVSRMARRRAIIRRLPAVETLGSTTVICSDKTGTLTENQMTVTAVTTASRAYSVSGTGYNPEGSVVADGGSRAPAESGALRECLLAGVLCNDSRLAVQDRKWSAVGDPTEVALIVAGAKAGLDQEKISAGWPRLDTIPFESERRFMATLHGDGRDGRVVYLKGASEAVLERCTSALDEDGRPAPVDRAALLQQSANLASRGLRVLALARGTAPAGTAHIQLADVASGLTFLGLAGMIDPPRPEVIEAVARCQQAGVRVKMITGDHPLTASAIATQIGLRGASGADGLAAMTGLELASVQDRDLLDVADRTAVFARVSPEQKLRLVEALQARGHVVAMTGDGVNDAPALKQANIGVAMGVTGTDVAKEAADMLLTDDNFATIEAAVEEGRCVFDNLTKFITWTLPTNVGEGLVILAAIFAGVTLPILPVQILWINMTTAVLLGLMLAFEPKEPGLMTRPPRNPATPILTRALVGRIVTVSVMLLAGAFGFFKWELATGATEAEARTVAVNVFVLVASAYLFNCRSLTESVTRVGILSNPLVFAGVAAMLLAQVAFTYLRPMNAAFHSAPVSAESWLRAAGVAVVTFALIEIEKWLRRRRNGARLSVL